MAQGNLQTSLAKVKLNKHLWENRGVLGQGTALNPLSSAFQPEHRALLAASKAILASPLLSCLLPQCSDPHFPVSQ